MVIEKLNARALRKLREAEQQQAAARAELRKAYPKKVLALALYGNACAGGCGLQEPSQLFLAHTTALLDPHVSLLRRGREYLLTARWHVSLYDYVIKHAADQGTAPANYAIFCWGCFKRVGKARRKARGIYYPSHPVARAWLAEEELKARAFLNNNL